MSKKIPLSCIPAVQWKCHENISLPIREALLRFELRSQHYKCRVLAIRTIKPKRAGSSCYLLIHFLIGTSLARKDVDGE